MDTRSLLFDVGDEICGWGRLVRTADGDCFDPPIPVALSRAKPELRPRPSRHRIRVEGANFDDVELRSQRGGVIEGYATVYGQWRGDRITVRRQTLQRPDPYRRRWSDPPCPPPPGGWPHGMNGHQVDNLDFDIGDLQERGAAVTVTVFRPSSDQAVLVVAASDIAAVEHQLRPQLRDRLCVVSSRWTQNQLVRARDHLEKRRELWGIFMIGGDHDEEGQASVTAALIRVTQEITDWVAGEPDGLVELRPWLVPSPLENPTGS